jgi:hypothetical protein
VTVGLKEMRECWTLKDVLDVNDTINVLDAAEAKAYEEAEREAKRKNK